MKKEELKEFCKLIGIYIDNAIEAVKNLDKKEIVLYINQIDKDIITEITNNYCGTINLEKNIANKCTINEKKHGYGLVIANQIINSERRITSKVYINGKTFCQLLRIKV